MKASDVNNQMEIIQEEQWTKVIGPRRGWFDINLPNLWNYRDLIILFVKRDFVAFYKQTILGPLWFLLQPLFTTIVFTVIFGRIAQIPTDGLPQMLFYMSGIVIWNYFANCLNNTSDTFVSNANIFGKVYFPRLTVPISIVITNLITFAIQFLLFLAFLSYFYLSGADIKMSFWVFLTPLLLLQMAALGLGLGILISSMTTKYRDLKFVVGFGVQLWMYATPIVYPMSQIPEKWQWLFALNPMAAIVEADRYAFLGAGAIRPIHLGLSLGMTALILFAGIVMFSRIEKTFMDTV
jgi:lipopolysaccharide transport system permease protein